ncbi:uncharacterized protein [Miscanthus floridulus]|uniref:uncharacterized protein isoform X1 n=1 Tax=Miscanthus floridulus TaxID=154761 RepID=UPI00345A027B
MSDEKRSERNKKRHERYKMNNQGRVDSHNNEAVHSTDGNTTNGMDENSDKLHMHSTNSNGANELLDGNTTNEMDENSDRLHRQSTYSNGLQQLSGSGYAPSPINQLVMCPNERKRDRDRARYAAIATEQRALQNKR